MLEYLVPFPEPVQIVLGAERRLFPEALMVCLSLPVKALTCGGSMLAGFLSSTCSTLFSVIIGQPPPVYLNICTAVF